MEFVRELQMSAHMGTLNSACLSCLYVPQPETPKQKISKLKWHALRMVTLSYRKRLGVDNAVLSTVRELARFRGSEPPKAPRDEENKCKGSKESKGT